MNTHILSAAISGFSLGASLIIAIGAQNAFILRQGLLRQHVFIVCLICSLADAVLITAGMGGFGALVARSPALIEAITLGGAVFLAFYAVRAFLGALHPGSLTAAQKGEDRLLPAIGACLAFTFLNPHVYLDTVFLIGGLSAQYKPHARAAFAGGAVLASFTWFYALGYGARLLAPAFARPSSWRALDLAIAFVMAILAAGLLRRLFLG